MAHFIFESVSSSGCFGFELVSCSDHFGFASWFFRVGCLGFMSFRITCLGHIGLELFGFFESGILGSCNFGLLVRVISGSGYFGLGSFFCFDGFKVWWAGLSC